MTLITQVFMESRTVTTNDLLMNYKRSEGLRNVNTAPHNAKEPTYVGI
jgi:hypothetical protein